MVLLTSSPRTMEPKPLYAEPLPIVGHDIIFDDEEVTIGPLRLTHEIRLPSVGTTSGHTSPLGSESPPLQVLGCSHQYALKSGDKNIATFKLMSRAQNSGDPPLLFLGDNIEGSLSFRQSEMKDVLGAKVVVRGFHPGRTDPVHEAMEKMVLGDVKAGSFNDNEDLVMWSFNMAMADRRSSWRSSSSGDAWASPVVCRITIKVKLRGLFNQRAVMEQELTFLPRFDSASSLLSFDESATSSRYTASQFSRAYTLSDTPYKDSTSPPAIIRGRLFDRDDAEISCKLVLPGTYPAGHLVPVKLIMTSTNLSALDLLSASHAIDIKLFRVHAYGKDTTTVAPTKLRNRSSYHIRKHIASACHWRLETTQRRLLPPDADTLQKNWRSVMNAEIQPFKNEEITPGWAVPHGASEPDVELRYEVHLYPFKVEGFQPVLPPDRVVLAARLTIVDER
ncbi:hypothetical protein OF83DRAFT_777954 [Amylostereum chailletii]|nr:hypothetical protein OF83DRAFT_777954 [Amylostereum chailletii]